MRLIDDNYLSAGSVDTPQFILENLSKHHSSSIRARVAENPMTPLHVLENLAKDNCSDVRKSIALNKNVPLDLISCLAGDENPDVRFSIADNSHSPMVALCWLTLDDNPYVSNRAKQTIQGIKHMLNTDFKSLGAQGTLNLTLIFS